jgi:outer membrane lipoprotein-sorting protein
MTLPADPTPRTVRDRLRTLLAVLAVALLASAGTGVAQEAAEVPDDADAILDRMVENLRGGGQRATLVMVVERDDDVREYRLEVISDGTERSLTRVVEPPRDAGQAFLVDGDELFVYSPRLGRALRLPPSGRSDGFLGSDLSYDDMAGDEVRDDYDAEVAGRDDATVTLSLIPHPTAPTPYGELRFTASIPDLAPLELEYFDQRGEAVKRLTFSEIHELDDGTRVPTHFEVVDLTADGGRTVADWTDVEFGVEPPDRCFTQQALERGCDW